MNLKGIQAKRKLLPDAESGTSIEFAMPRKARAFVLPFLGDVSEASTSYSNGKLEVRVPPFQRSVVVWFEDNGPQ
jgi:HSP20 family molecular chaperone IbpA